MICGRCHSHRTIRFIDGFGKRRMFCRNCHNSVKLSSSLVVSQKKLGDFNNRWKNERIKNMPSSFIGR